MKYLNIVNKSPTISPMMCRFSTIALALILSPYTNANVPESREFNNVTTLPLTAQPLGWAKGRILVQTKAGVASSQLANILQVHGMARDNTLRSQSKLSLATTKTTQNVHILHVEDDNEQAAIALLRKDPNIEFAELDRLVPLAQIQPDDTYYDKGWHLPKMNVVDTWDITKGDNVVVAVLDTGVDSNHSDLDYNVLAGWNTVNQDNDSSDILGHGTKVAGVIAALSDNEIGVTSIAWNATILPIRITNATNGYAYISDIAAGLVWAADNGADIANVSYAVSSSYTIINAANYMRSRGGVVVMSAGNSGTNLNCQANPSVITVSATGTNDVKAGWSDFGDCIDVAAPGVSIWTTKNGGGYGGASGTSFSAPATAGVLALIKAASQNLTIDELEQVLKDSANKSQFEGDFSIQYGYGRVDASAAVALALSRVDVDQQTPTVTITSPVTGSAHQGQFIVDVDAQDNVAVSYVELFANGLSVAIDQTVPYQFNIDSSQYEIGGLTLQANAYDSAGNLGVSTEQQLIIEDVTDGQDTIAPKLRLRKPAQGSIITGRQRIVAKAKDDVELASVEILINGESVAQTTTKQRLVYKWRTKKIAAGLYEIVAIATDTSGNKTLVTRNVTVAKQ